LRVTKKKTKTDCSNLSIPHRLADAEESINAQTANFSSLHVYRISSDSDGMRYKPGGRTSAVNYFAEM